jgi:hypothetical protein
VMQGFLFSKPLPAGDVARWLEQTVLPCRPATSAAPSGDRAPADAAEPDGVEAPGVKRRLSSRPLA